MPKNDYAHKTKARVLDELGLYFFRHAVCD